MRQHLVSAAFPLTCVRPYPDPRVSYLPPLFAREGPFSPICASAIQSFFRSERQLLFPSRHPLHPDPRVSHTIPASARQVPLCPFFARQTFFARHSPCARPQLLFALPRVRYPLTRSARQLPSALAPLRTSAATVPPSRASELPTDPCVSSTLLHVIQVARQLICLHLNPSQPFRTQSRQVLSGLLLGQAVAQCGPNPVA